MLRFSHYALRNIIRVVIRSSRCRDTQALFNDEHPGRFRAIEAVATLKPATRIHEIVKERRGITAGTAERLARYFGGDASPCLARPQITAAPLTAPPSPATTP